MASAPENSQPMQRLLQPIPGTFPTGPDLRESVQINAFSKLQGVIKEDRRYQEKAGHEGTLANWVDVRQRAIDILAEEGKDLEVAVWLVRALVKTDGLDGLRNGLELLRGLHAQFGEDLHPKDIDLRRSRLEWLDQQLEMDLRVLPVPNASQREQLTAWARTLKEEIADIEKTVIELKARYSEEPPAFSHCRRALDFLATGINAAGGDFLADALAPGNENSPGSTAPSSHASSGPRNRDEALRMLELVAAYFGVNEPLSPVPHLLRRAVRWARGSLQQWLDEMVAKEDQLEVIYKTLDMSKPVPKE